MCRSLIIDQDTCRLSLGYIHIHSSDKQDQQMFYCATSSGQVWGMTQHRILWIRRVGNIGHVISISNIGVASIEVTGDQGCMTIHDTDSEHSVNISPVSNRSTFYLSKDGSLSSKKESDDSVPVIKHRQHALI